MSKFFTKPFSASLPLVILIPFLEDDIMHRLWKLALCALFLASCGSIDRFMVGQTGSLFQKAAKGLENEGHYPSFQDSVLANIKIIEGLLAVKPDDKALLMTIIKAHAGAGFGVFETQYFENYYRSGRNGEEAEVLKAKYRTLYHYSQAIIYGNRWLATEGLHFSDLAALSSDSEKMQKEFKSHIGDSDEDLEALLFYAQALGGFMNLQQDRMELVAYLPVAKNMFDYVCGLRPNIYWNTCDIFYAAYESGRPSMLGGNPEKGQEIFKKLLEKSPEHWLAAASYLQFYVIPMNDKKEFDRILEVTASAVEKWDEELLWSPSLVLEPSAEKIKLLQSIGIERLRMIKKWQNKIF
jgi:hypothetical protein